MGNTFIIKEDVLNEISDAVRVTPAQFNANMRYFLHQLLDDPVNAEIPTCIKMARISRPEFLQILIDRGVIKRSERLNDKDKDGNFKTPTMSVKYTVLNKIPDDLEYKVSKNDFDRNIEKIRRLIFEKNISEDEFNTRLGDQLAIAKNSPLTMGYLAPQEKKGDSVSWLTNRADEALNGDLDSKKDELEEEGGGATACDASGQFSQPLFGVIKRKIEERITNDKSFSGRYRDLGGGFDVVTEDGQTQQSLVTIENKGNKTLYHICFDGANFNIYRDMRDGEPCVHVSYVFDKLLDAFDNNGYVNISENKRGKVFRVTEEQAALFQEATATSTVGGKNTNYQYTVPFPIDKNDETMQRHNGEDGSVSVNTIKEANKESLHTSNVGDYINDNPIVVHPEDPTMKRGEGKRGSHSVERVEENKKKQNNFFKKHGIEEVEIGLGFSEKEQKWYGWSHRAIQGFGIGDKFLECYPTETKEGDKIKTMEQAKEAAKKFAESVS